jgi:hypothetical protein
MGGVGEDEGRCIASGFGMHSNSRNPQLTERRLVRRVCLSVETAKTQGSSDRFMKLLRNEEGHVD